MYTFLSTVLASLLAFAFAGEAVAQSAPMQGVVLPRAGVAGALGGETDEGQPVVSERPVSFGRVPWVLVVEAVRSPKGELVPWERDGEWARLWRVPGDAAGTRYVPVEGDAEDREHVRNPDGNSKDSVPAGLGFLAGKYRAPAIVLVVREPSGVGVIPWRGGYGSWSRSAVPVGAPTEDAKTEALKLIARVFSGSDRRDELANPSRLAAKVLAFREASGGILYQVVVRGRIAQQQLLKLIERAGGLSVAEIVTTLDGYDVVLSDPSGEKEPIERRLSRAGLPTEASGRQAQELPGTAASNE